jgi:hypothetical protein
MATIKEGKNMEEERNLNTVVNDDHYSRGSLQVWDVVDKLGLSWAAGNVLKYLARYKHKGQGKEDLLKAFDYLCKEANGAMAIKKEDLIKIIERHWK